MTSLRNFIEKINMKAGFTGAIRYDEPLALHTTFKVGGPADLWIRPDAGCFPSYGALLLHYAQAEGFPVFVLGGGANLVAADQGIRGIVLDTGGWAGLSLAGEEAIIRSGTGIDAALDVLAAQGRGGLEFLAGMPGSWGGALWMNARCYEQSLSDVLVSAEYVDADAQPCRVPYRPEDYGYKQSPFQQQAGLILSVRLKTLAGSEPAIRQEMEKYRLDRERKGHYRFPSAGSAFKNNRNFGKPTGKILDELGFRGLAIGGAAVAPWHGNIIINTGNALAKDIWDLVTHIMEQVHRALGIRLEPEIRFVGDWPPSD
ncbi:MAG: UDP-N-acetylmuramate dehydrogenase [Spirochaetaceae bacterium]|jgi:UDP-N-acetylmuramate dehydrogenase|nr:UDP-N-acetylmuramate dehydrogenase [Spirochaetaceae bacterium]